MKILVSVLFFASLTPSFFGCKTFDEGDRARRKEAVREQYRQDEANRIVGDIFYIKDPRTDLCFAYYWGGSGNGGPALATVPCENIPIDLLTEPQ